MLDFVRRSFDRSSTSSAKVRNLLDGGGASANESADGGELATEEEQSSPPVLAMTSTSFSKKAGKYILRAEGGLLHVDPRKLNGSVDSRVGQVGAATILNFRDKRIGMVSPVVLDLDGDGVELRSRKGADARFDMDGDGIRDDTGWVGRNDGLLVIDRNGDGRITSASEISFLTENPAATSDLDALSALDSNRDNLIDASDRRFSELKLWVDRNGNGVSDEGELKSLGDHGIQSISLSARSAASTAKLGSNMLLATSTFTRTDGSVGTVGDVALAFRPSARPQANGGEPAPDDVPSNVKDEDHRDLEQTLSHIDAGTRPFTFPSAPHFTSQNFDGSLRQAPTAIELRAQEGQVGELGVGGLETAASLLPIEASDPELGYRNRIEVANARLIQALSAFGEAAPMAEFSKQPMLDAVDRPEWLTVASLPSVSKLLAIS